MRLPTRLPLAACLLGAVPAAAQRPDSAVALPEQAVTVTRAASPLQGLGASVSVLDTTALRRGRWGAGLDEALAFVPGVVIGNRWNWSVDQRVSIRGFGARANFGLRGLRVLVDGVPQTLPDGQSQLSNLDLATVRRVEVLRGASSALYGNAGGGALSFTTAAIPRAPWLLDARVEGGAFGSWRTQLVAAARGRAIGGTIAASRFVTDGYRQHSAAEQRRVNAAADWLPSAHTTVTLRAAIADDPRAENPGALTAAELAARPDSAAANNILRAADKAVTQSQVSIGVAHDHGRWHLDAGAWYLERSLDNPLATPPPAPTGADIGTWVGIERSLWGSRLAARADLPGATITAGVDLQHQRDDRSNERAAKGVPTGTLLLDQREVVSTVGPFVQASLPLAPRLAARAGARYDATTFDVTDRFLSDGDASGSQTLASWSGNGGLSLRVGAAGTLWISVATAFETPTTTELANRPAGDGGFNADLDPQRSVSVEAGWRGTLRRAQLELSLYRTTARDAIVPYREVGGRTYYRNAGGTRTRGAELGVAIPLVHGLQLLSTWTVTDAIFTDYRVQDGATADTLDGKRLAGLPVLTARLGIRGTIGAHVTIDVDHAISTSQYADDRNTIRVDGWGAGVTGARVAWSGTFAGGHAAPFVAVTNLFDRRYVGSVSLNGANGRAFEPSAGRAIYAGFALGVEGRTR